MIHDIVVEAQVERLCERGLQVGITPCLVHGVGIIVDVKQLFNRRLAGASTILETQLALLIEAPAEVSRRAPVSDGTVDDCVNTQVALGIF